MRWTSAPSIVKRFNSSQGPKINEYFFYSFFIFFYNLFLCFFYDPKNAVCFFLYFFYVLFIFFKWFLYGTANDV